MMSQGDRIMVLTPTEEQDVLVHVKPTLMCCTSFRHFAAVDGNSSGSQNISGVLAARPACSTLLRYPSRTALAGTKPGHDKRLASQHMFYLCVPASQNAM